MSLAVCIGVLADAVSDDPEGAEWIRADLAAINDLLRANGLPSHEEPVTPFPVVAREGPTPPAGFPYSWLHRLRRVLAFARQNPEGFCPAPDHWSPDTDDLLDIELTATMDSHLICHSDCEGYYVPIDFPEPLYFKENILGGILGSSQAVLRELGQVAPLLDIPLRDGKLAADEARAIVTETEEDNPYWLERLVWLCLYDHLSASVEHGYVVRFG